VATETGANDLVVVQRCNDGRPVTRWHPVAGFADIGCIGMIARFARRNTAIMATETATDDFIVIQWCYKR